MRFAVLDISSLQEVLDMELGLNDPMLCIRSDEEVISECLNSGYSLGAYNGEVLVAFSLFYYNEYGCGFVEKCFVSPTYRGRSLQSRLLNSQMSMIGGLNLHSVYALCSEDNYASMKSFARSGYEVLKRTMLEGYPRAILRYEVGC